MLIKNDKIKRDQKNMFESLIENAEIRKKWLLIVWNGDGLILRTPWGITTVNKNISINDALQNIKEDVRMKTVKYIGIISGDLANRGISFVSKDYQWHLTHMILSASNSSSGTALTQSLRLCGCYNDDIPLEMFTSNEIVTELFAYDYLQQKSLDKCDEMIYTTQLRKTLSTIKIKPECIVRRPIDLKMRLKFKIISDYDKIICGEKIDTDTVVEAQELVRQKYNETPIVYVTERNTNLEYNEEEIKRIKKELKGNGFNYINVIKSDKLCLIKNPQHVTKTHKMSEVMITEKNKQILLYVKSKVELVYNQLFIFQTPSGIYVSRSTDNKDELEEMFKKHFTLDM